MGRTAGAWFVDRGGDRRLRPVRPHSRRERRRHGRAPARHDLLHYECPRVQYEAFGTTCFGRPALMPAFGVRAPAFGVLLWTRTGVRRSPFGCLEERGQLLIYVAWVQRDVSVRPAGTATASGLTSSSSAAVVRRWYRPGSRRRRRQARRSQIGSAGRASSPSTGRCSRFRELRITGLTPPGFINRCSIH